jgi:hypothetical protein
MLKSGRRHNFSELTHLTVPLAKSKMRRFRIHLSSPSLYSESETEVETRIQHTLSSILAFIFSSHPKSLTLALAVSRWRLTKTMVAHHPEGIHSWGCVNIEVQVG